jgi:hypothetical protein
LLGLGENSTVASVLNESYDVTIIRWSIMTSV